MKEPQTSEKQSGNLLSSIYQAIMKDGTIAAAGRQGIAELGEALKAFPDSIQVREVGTIFAPTQGEIAEDRKAIEMSPAEIAQDQSPSTIQNSMDQDQSRGR
jgi:hypothetical protein